MSRAYGLSSLALRRHPFVQNPHQNVNLDLVLAREGTDRVKRIFAGMVAALFLALGAAAQKSRSARFLAAARIRAKPGIPAGGR